MKRKCALIGHWFPRNPSRDVKTELATFYSSNAAYHEMTSSGAKTRHPQVQLLMCLIRNGGRYAEAGCGGGAVCKLIGERASVMGFDCSQIAIDGASETCGAPNVEFRRADAQNLPLADSSVDGVYSFEMLEHVWDPLASVREMIRVVKPGGFVLLSMPNGYSLDVHLRKRLIARWCEYVLAAFRYACDRITDAAFVNIEPHLDGPIYPDCDMITAIIPANIARAMEKMGCRIEFWDTTYMCAQREGSGTDLRFQKLCVHPFFKHFGDHILILAYKK